MAALPAKTVFAVAVILAAVLTANPSLADPAGSNTAPTGRRFEYGPYGSPNNSQGGGQAIPQNNAVDPAGNDDGADRAPVDAAEPAPGDDDRELSRVEVRASAPDSNVPYEIREHDARSAAIEAWRSKVADRFGPEFAHWRTAADKHVDCTPDDREGLVCIASGVPVRGFDRYGRWHREGQ